MDYAGLYPPHPASGRHRACGNRRAYGAGAARLCQGLGTSRAVEGREGRQAHGDALEALRAGGRRRVQRHGRGIQDRHRHRNERIQRVLRGRAAEGFGRRQHRLGSRSRLGPAYAAAAVPDPGAADERRRRLSRQEVWRVDRRGRDDLQAGQQLARHSRRDHRRLHDLPQIGRGKGRLQGFPEGLPGLPRNVQGAEEEQHAGRLPARSRLGRRQCLAALDPVGPRRLHRRQGRQGHHQLAGNREGARILQGAVRHLHSRRRVLERLVQQQGVSCRANCIAPPTASRSMSRPRTIRPRRNSPKTPITRCGRSVRSGSRPNCSSAFRSWRSSSPNIRTPQKPSSPSCSRRKTTTSG